MEIKVVQHFDENYYKEYYSEWLRFRSVFKKWEDKIGMFSLALAVLIYLYDRELFFISVGLSVFGCLMIYEFYSSKKKWMKSRLESKMNNKSATLIFEDDQIQSLGPFTELKGKWEIFNQAIETEKGLFLFQENGISIYLQKKVFQNPSDIQKIVNKVRAN